MLLDRSARMVTRANICSLTGLEELAMTTAWPSAASATGNRGKVGLFGIGLAAYWPQFPGMKERLQGYQQVIAGRLGELADVVDAGLIDSAPQAALAGDRFARERV